MPTLNEQERKFILHWGEMGSRWGISRAVAQIHALLLIAPQPLNAQDISESLGLARSNVSTGLRELEGWGIVSIVHLMGDRRDYFQTLTDPWQILFVIADKRIQREIEPTLALLNELSSKTGKDAAAFQQRISGLRDLIDTGIHFYRRIRLLPLPLMKRLLKFDQKVARSLER
jgi:DNA-binding transcriptional regulator GbsR (MarR family)